MNKVLLLFIISIIAPASHGETEEVVISTFVNKDMLFTKCQPEVPCLNSDKAILILPKLKDYVRFRHNKASYISGETSENSVEMLISQIINDATDSFGFANVKYTIERETFFEGRKQVHVETLTAQFPNGLTLESVDRVGLIFGP